MTRRSYVLSSQASFSAEFARCCRQYDALSIAVAWCGDPGQTLPYKLLENFKGTVHALIGIAFDHTHPDAIRWFLDIKANVRIFKDDGNLFHPKLYLFRRKHGYALFIGSSNFTFGGFYKNHEINCLLEGSASEELPRDIEELSDALSRWRAAENSFRPTSRWLTYYQRRHEESLRRQRRNGAPTPALYDEAVPAAGWLKRAEWDVYYGQMLAALEKRGANNHDYFGVFHAAAQELAVPWRPAYFGELEKRRIMGGIGRYGSLGHVAASGQVRRLFARGGSSEKAAICNALNAIARLEPPVSLATLTSQLKRLVSLGPSMRVWGRLLCLIRPDLYCTVSALSVRQALADASGIAKSRLDRPEGYVQLIAQIHASPWFEAERPSDESEAMVWERRTALLDAIFYQ